MLNSQEQDNLEDQLLRGGKGARELMELNQLADEEGLSDDERREQIENNKYYTFLRNQRIDKHLKEMEEKDKKMEEEMGGLLVDYNEKKSSKTTAMSSKNSKVFQPMSLNMFGVKPLNQKKVQASIQETENKNPAGTIAVASGMQKFMKTSTTEAPPKVKASIPLIFRRKAPAAK